MIKITKDDVLKIHKLIVEVNNEKVDVRDMGLLESSIASTYQTFGEQDLYDTIEKKAVHMCYSIIENHPFADGNKRVGIMMLLVMLKAYGVKKEFTDKELIEIGYEVAKGNLAKDTILEKIMEHKD